MRMSEVEAETTEEVEALPVDESVEPVEETGPPDPHSLGLELPDAPEEAIELLLTELGTARREGTSYLDDLKRVAADFDNYRKRSTGQSAQMLDRATEKVVSGLLPVLDSFDAALSGHAAETENEHKLFSGMLSIREQLLAHLRNEGLELIPTFDEPFDPEIHEPVAAPSGDGNLVVTQELRRGYRLNGKVLRAALVVLEVQ